MLKIETYHPKILSSFIQSFEYYNWKGFDPNTTFPYSLFPTGTVQLLFQFNTPVNHKTTFTKEWQNRPNVFIGGPYDKAYEMEMVSSSEILSVTFKHSMFKYFFGKGLNQLKDQLVHPTEVWGARSEGLIDQVTLAKSNEMRIEIIEKFLLTQVRDIDKSPIEGIVTKLISDRGHGSLDHYANLSNLSLSRFRARFREEVGLSPKVLQKLVKVKAVSRYYFKNPSISLSHLAHQFGYFDQSHFIKDFKKVTNSAPLRYFQDKRFLQF